MNLILPGSTRDPKVEIPRLNELMLLLTNVAINLDGGTRVAAGTPCVSIRESISRSILLDLLYFWGFCERKYFFLPSPFFEFTITMFSSLLSALYI